ncbi:hypothetical protein [Kitasatospora sp. NPDC057015]|uniref:hypothetical protein n=1 Tax=Kitasatospora sp. NPDC057015 TaxID=3346001 RepID=UPI00363A91EA
MYLLQHRAEMNHPLYLGILATASFAALITADRLLKQRTRLRAAATSAGRRPPID